MRGAAPLTCGICRQSCACQLPTHLTWLRAYVHTPAANHSDEAHWQIRMNERSSLLHKCNAQHRLHGLTYPTKFTVSLIQIVSSCQLILWIETWFVVVPYRQSREHFNNTSHVDKIKGDLTGNITMFTAYFKSKCRDRYKTLPRAFQIVTAEGYFV